MELEETTAEEIEEADETTADDAIEEAAEEAAEDCADETTAEDTGAELQAASSIPTAPTKTNSFLFFIF
jgi:hypothetical protein